MRDLNPEISAWSTTIRTNEMIADIIDVLLQINSNLVAIGSKRPAKKPKPYPRPNKKNPEDDKHIGSGALPPDELQKWFDKKRAEHHARSSTSHHYSDSRTEGSTAKLN